MDQSFAAFLSVLDHPFWNYFCTETNLLVQPVDDILVRFKQKCPGVNFRRPKWCYFGMCAHLAFFCADLRPLYTFFGHVFLHLLLVFLAESENHKWRPKALSLRRTAREASKRGATLRFLANRAAIGTTTFREQNATHSCKARCLILFRQLRHCVPFSTPLFGSEKLPVSSIRSLRVFTPLCGF